jgi:WD40 repeat protein
MSICDDLTNLESTQDHAQIKCCSEKIKITDLPDHLFVDLLSNLIEYPIWQNCEASKVCSQWRDAVGNSELWKKYFFKRFGTLTLHDSPVSKSRKLSGSFLNEFSKTKNNRDPFSTTTTRSSFEYDESSVKPESLNNHNCQKTDQVNIESDFSENFDWKNAYGMSHTLENNFSTCSYSSCHRIRRGPVTDLCVSSAGRVYAAGQNGSVFEYNLANNEYSENSKFSENRIYQSYESGDQGQFKSPVVCCEIFEKNNLIFGGFSNGFCEIWKIEDTKTVQKFHAHRERVSDLKIFENQSKNFNNFVTCSSDGTFKIWDLNSNFSNPVTIFSSVDSSARPTKFCSLSVNNHSDNNLIALGCKDSKWSIYDCRRSRG